MWVINCIFGLKQIHNYNTHGLSTKDDSTVKKKTTRLGDNKMTQSTSSIIIQDHKRMQHVHVVWPQLPTNGSWQENHSIEEDTRYYHLHAPIFCLKLRNPKHGGYIKIHTKLALHSCSGAIAFMESSLSHQYSQPN